MSAVVRIGRCAGDQRVGVRNFPRQYFELGPYGSQGMPARRATGHRNRLEAIEIVAEFLARFPRQEFRDRHRLAKRDARLLRGHGGTLLRHLLLPWSGEQAQVHHFGGEHAVLARPLLARQFV